MLLTGGSPVALSAQSRTSSAIRGTVVQEDGSPAAGAEVLVRHQDTGAERAAVTNENGAFLVLLLQPGGPYTLTVESLGFADHREEDLILQVGEVTLVEVVLRAQAVELEGLEVEVERAPVFDRSLVGPATRLTERTVESMPILSRDIMELALLSPLVKPTESGGFSVAGQNDRYNAILIDGVLNKDVFGLTSGGVPGGQAGAKLIPLDAVSQYEVLIAPFDVRLSGFTGGVMNAVTRSGTNDWRVRAAAVHRAEALMGDLNLATGPVEASGVDRSLVALSVGGPLARDRAHFFVSGEFEERSQVPLGYNLFRDDPSLIRISIERMAALQEAFEGAFGLETGTAEAYPLDQGLSNLFARLDWNIARGHRLTARNVFARATNDETPNRTGFDPYELSSNAVFRTSTSNTTSLQLFSDIDGLGSNELELSVARITDETTPASDWPQVEVELLSTVDGSSYQRETRFGGDFFAQENRLEQTAFRLTNSLDLLRGDDVITVGVTASYLDLAHAFLPGARGEYFFPSLAALEANTPSRYQRGVLGEGEEAEARFDVLEWGAFVQNQMNPGRGLTLRFGLRVDVSHVLSSPTRNLDVLDYFGYDTSEMPSGNVLLSPRWGFNWQSGGERRTQVRAGGGMFTGQISYVWLADAFHNDGLRSGTVVCVGDDTPAFDPTGVLDGCGLRRNVVVFDPGFRFPQDLKFSVSVDRELTDRMSGTLGALFSKALNQVSIESLNVEQGGNPPPGYGGLGEGRRFYGFRGAPFDQVLLVGNDGEDWGASITAELRGRITDRVRFQAGYALARSWDRASLVFADMISNIGLNPVAGNIDRPSLETSNFDRPHKFVATLFGSPFPALPETEISLLYTGQSGLPFTYVYDFDVNGDGLPGLGGAFERYNDPVLVPFEADDLPGTIATQILTAGALKEDACLRANRGRILDRNACRAPWEHRLDLRLAHTLRLAGAQVRLEGDLINVLNLLNGEWGRVEAVRPQIPLYELCDCTGALLRWGGGVLPRRNEQGQIRPSAAWNPVSPDSQWQIQLGARVTFAQGGR